MIIRKRKFSSCGSRDNFCQSDCLIRKKVMLYREERRGRKKELFCGGGKLVLIVEDIIPFELCLVE